MHWATQAKVLLMLTHMLVAVDGSAGSQKALLHARGWALQSSARLAPVTVIEPLTPMAVAPVDAYVMPPPYPAPENLARVQTLLNEAAAALPKDRVKSRVEVGTAAETVCRVANQEGADLIIIGARTLSAVTRWLLGSVGDSVVHHAKMPVMVVR